MLLAIVPAEVSGRLGYEAMGPNARVVPVIVIQGVDVFPALLLAAIQNWYEAATEGVPESRPVVPLSVRPVGKVPPPTA